MNDGATGATLPFALKIEYIQTQDALQLSVGGMPGGVAPTIWLGPEAARLVASLPRTVDRDRVFPEDLTSSRLYTFWCGVREEAGLSGLRIHDLRHSWASQGVMNSVGLPTVGKLLGHSRRLATTAIYAHLDDSALQAAAGKAAGAIAEAMGFRVEASPEKLDTSRIQPAPVPLVLCAPVVLGLVPALQK